MRWLHRPWICVLLFALFAGFGPAGFIPYAAADSKADIDAAIKKLAESKNYSWTITTAGIAGAAGNGLGSPVPTISLSLTGRIDCATDTAGLTTLFCQDKNCLVVIHNDKIAVQTEDGWKSAAEILNGYVNSYGENPYLGLANISQNFKTPAKQLQQLGVLSNLQKADDHYHADLTPGAAAGPVAQLGCVASGGTFAATGASGSIDIWIDKGVLSKCEFTVAGVAGGWAVRGNVTYEFKDIGSTAIQVPKEAKQLLAMPIK